MYAYTYVRMHVCSMAKCQSIGSLKSRHNKVIYVYMHACTFIYGCTLHIIIHIDILLEGSSVGMDPIDDDVAIWCEKTLRNKYTYSYVYIPTYIATYVRT